MIREANPIILVSNNGIIIYASGKVVFPHKDPPEYPLQIEEIGLIATTMYNVAAMKDSKYRSATLEFLHSALKEKTASFTA